VPAAAVHAIESLIDQDPVLRSQPATPDNGEGPSGSGVQGVRRTMRVKLDLKVTTSTKRID
jgi:hypothetical protein